MFKRSNFHLEICTIGILSGDAAVKVSGVILFRNCEYKRNQTHVKMNKRTKQRNLRNINVNNFEVTMIISMVLKPNFYANQSIHDIIYVCNFGYTYQWVDMDKKQKNVILNIVFLSTNGNRVI